MAQSPSIIVHQVCSVSPPQDTPPISLPFTFFDVLWTRLHPVERLFFYSFPNPTSSFFDSVLPNLKHSLSLTLQHFPSLAGTITWPLHSSLPLITYNPGDTISFTIAESNADFNTLTSNFTQVNLSQNLIPQLTFSRDHASVLALQLTLFPNQGFCIGIVTHHAALDGKSSTLFMKSWAYICSHLKSSPSPPPQSFSLPNHLTPSFDRSVIKDPLGIGQIYADSWLNFGGTTNDRSLNALASACETQSDLVKGVFELTPSDIKKLKKIAGSNVDSDKNVRVTSFTITCAYLMVCAVKVEVKKGERVPFVFVVDSRARLDPPISETYFGNCVVPRLAVAKREEVLGDGGLFKIVEGISDALDELESNVLNDAENWIPKIQSVMEEGIFSVAGSPRFEVYGVDFGWGKPKKVDVTSVDKTGAFALSESRVHSGGIEIGLALKKGQMEAFSAAFAHGLESLEL